MREFYHAFIMTSDRKFFEGAAEKKNNRDYIVSVDRTMHPTKDENELLAEMEHVLVNFNRPLNERK